MCRNSQCTALASKSTDSYRKQSEIAWGRRRRPRNGPTISAICRSWPGHNSRVASRHSGKRPRDTGLARAKSNRLHKVDCVPKHCRERHLHVGGVPGQCEAPGRHKQEGRGLLIPPAEGGALTGSALAVAVMPPSRKPPSRSRRTCGTRWRLVPGVPRRASTRRR